MPLIRGRAKGGPLGGSRLNEGFLGTAAPRYADVVLLLEIGIGGSMRCSHLWGDLGYTPGVSPLSYP